MNFKETFLKLTEYTIPHGHEDDLVKLLPNGIKKDNIGNYFIKIGESKTLFTCHLDTYSKEYKKVNHIIDGNIIKTDGTTILGADNKAGVVCLLYMIENNVPGLYFFFISEEPISEKGGLYGSSELAYTKLNSLKKYERAIAFDRKHKGSIITRQMAEPCCSDEFADALIDEFSKQGVIMEKDKTGYYTDTAAFLEIIPECSNISIGVWNEHHNNEYVDISYVESVSKAAIKINWEDLPVIRSTEYFLKDEVSPNRSIQKKYGKYNTSKNDSRLFEIIKRILEDDFYVLKSRKGFDSGKEMLFNHWFDETNIKIVVNNGKVSMNGKDVRPDKKSILKLLT